MARRRRIEDAPPAASSSGEEEETDDQEEQQEEETPNGTVQTQQNGASEKQDDDESRSEDDEDGEEDEDDDEEEKEKPILPPSKPSKPDSESDSENDSADTELTAPASPSLSDFTIKPISLKSKPGPKPEQPKKEKDGDNKNDKKGKRGAGGGGSQRLWSDEDEIVILNGMVEYQNEKGKNPFADTGDFHEFVRESLHVDATNNQFVDKIRKLKKKYFTDEIFSKPHDLECAELAKRIWGAGGIEVGNKGNSSKKSGKNVIVGGGVDSGGGVGGGIILALAKKGTEEANVEKGKVIVKKGKGALGEEVSGEGKGKGGKKKKRTAEEEFSEKGEEVNVTVTVKKQKGLVNDEMNGGGMELSVKKRNAVAKDEGSDDLWDKYPYLCSSLDGENLTDVLKERTMSMLGMVREEKLVELEREWRSLMKVKLEFIVKQKDLIAKQIKLSLDVMKSLG